MFRGDRSRRLRGGDTHRPSNSRADAATQVLEAPPRRRRHGRRDADGRGLRQGHRGAGRRQGPGMDARADRQGHRPRPPDRAHLRRHLSTTKVQDRRHGGRRQLHRRLHQRHWHRGEGGLIGRQRVCWRRPRADARQGDDVRARGVAARLLHRRGVGARAQGHRRDAARPRQPRGPRERAAQVPRPHARPGRVCRARRVVRRGRAENRLLREIPFRPSPPPRKYIHVAAAAPPPRDYIHVAAAAPPRNYPRRGCGAAASPKDLHGTTRQPRLPRRPPRNNAATSPPQKTSTEQRGNLAGTSTRPSNRSRT